MYGARACVLDTDGWHGASQFSVVLLLLEATLNNEYLKSNSSPQKVTDTKYLLSIEFQ